MTTFDKIPDILRLNNCEYWTIRTKKDANSYIFKCDKSLSFDDNIERMKQVMRIYNGSYFMLEGKENADSNKGAFCYEFSNQEQAPSTAAVGNVPVMSGGVSESEMQSRIENECNKIRFEFMQKDLERRERDLAEREKEYRKEKESTVGILVDRIGKVLPRLFPQVAVAGIEGERVPVAPVQISEDTVEVSEEEIDEATREIEQLLERFAAVEPEWLPLLRKMVAMAEAQDSTYKMARNFLLS